ncbi:MAG: hypothetical protein H6R26_46 [Proteobacteria bacterium]|nr:hypothetical protein [Pseudomonadota bacterium]
MPFVNCRWRINFVKVALRLPELNRADRRHESMAGDGRLRGASMMATLLGRFPRNALLAPCESWTIETQAHIGEEAGTATIVGFEVRGKRGSLRRATVQEMKSPDRAAPESYRGHRLGIAGERHNAAAPWNEATEVRSSEGWPATQTSKPERISGNRAATCRD